MYFRNYRLQKILLDKCLKGAISEHPLTVNMLKGPKPLWSLHDRTFIIFFHHSGGNWIGIFFLIVICKIFGLFGNTMTADNKYSLRSSENLLQPIQMKLSKNQRTFSNFFAHFWNKQQILNILKKKDYPHNLYIFEITEYERYT